MSVTFTVSGYGQFPVDMLRYDSCWPMGPDDAMRITESFADSHRWTVTLTSDMKGGVPCFGRWESFSCSVEVQP